MEESYIDKMIDEISKCPGINEMAHPETQEHVLYSEEERNRLLEVRKSKYEEYKAACDDYDRAMLSAFARNYFHKYVKYTLPCSTCTLITIMYVENLHECGNRIELLGSTITSGGKTNREITFEGNDSITLHLDMLDSEYGMHPNCTIISREQYDEILSEMTKEITDRMLNPSKTELP